MKYSFICPNCKRVQNSVIQGQSGTIYYELNFETEQWEEKDVVAQDVEGYFCPKCRYALPVKLTEEIEEKVKNM